MQGPLVSIITVSYNNASTIDACLSSVKEQLYEACEHIIIDGASTDGSQEIIQSYLPKYFISEPDHGIYHAMNKGLNQVQGEYCLFLNADDKFNSNHVITELVKSSANLDLLCASIQIFKGKSLYRNYCASRFKPWMFLFGHQPPHPGFFCKTFILKELNGFNESYKIAGDFDLMLRVFSNPNLKWKTAKLIAVNMQHGGASSGSLNKKQLMNKEVKHSLKENGRTAWTILIWAKYLFKVFQIKVF
jgi:glycosyltransferase involved in cell wall biosynthesis